MADLANKVALLVQKNFKKFGTIRKLSSYISVSDSTYTPSTGVAVAVVAAAKSIYIIYDVFSFTATQAVSMIKDEEPVLEGDMKAMFPRLDLAAAPAINDTITDADGKKWRVVGLSKDPVPALHELHVRPYV